MTNDDARHEMLRDLRMLTCEYEMRIDRLIGADREQTLRLIWELSACIDRLEKELSNNPAD